MAATRLTAIHHLKGRSMVSCLKVRIDYYLNPDKTENGVYTSFYECTPNAVVEEFALSKREYEHITGRSQQRSVLAYMIRQSFKPGEISPEDANKVGYELAMRFTKGKHAFFVATHTDRKHIHNHICFNSTTLDCTRKFKNYFLSGRALQKLSDLICIENSLSVIEPKPYSERIKENRYKDSVTKRDLIRRDIDEILLLQPKDFEDFLKKLKEKGYEFKRGKYLSLKKNGDTRYIRFKTLGAGYTEKELNIFFTEKIRVSKKKKGYQKKLSLLIDIQEKLQEGKGGGYAYWAKVFNVKQMAKTILFLQEHQYESYEQLDDATNAAIEKYQKLAECLKKMEGQLTDAKKMKEQIINYSKTRETYIAYRKSGYSKKFFEEKKEEIVAHKAAKETFEKLGGSTIPRVKELNQQISALYEERRSVFEEYLKLKEEMREMLVVRENVQRILEEKNPKHKRKKYVLQ